MNCAGCRTPATYSGETAPSHDMGPDFGWLLPVGSFGYYGGFDDSFGDEVDEVFVCHDCAVRLVDLLPGLAPRRGAHPNRNEWLGAYRGDPLTYEPCCPYAWTLVGDVVYVVSDGVWVPAPPPA